MEIINKFNKVAGCQIYSKTPVDFRYTNNKLTEKQIMETFPFTIATKKVKIQ